MSSTATPSVCGRPAHAPCGNCSGPSHRPANRPRSPEAACRRPRSGTLGKVTNCRFGVGVHTASDTASCTLPWRLYLPRRCDGAQAAARQARRRIPAGGPCDTT
ncbi:transposase [Streptomyces sp. NPDC001880]